MVTDKKFVAYCKECKRPLNGTLHMYHNEDGTWSFDMFDMSCERTEYLYDVYKNEFGLGEDREVDEKQDEAFDDMVAEHFRAWVILESLNDDGKTKV